MLEHNSPDREGRGYMKQPVSARIRRTGFTLVELLVATTLSLMLMGAVVYMVGKVGEGVTNSRAMLESADRLRLAESRLQMDLAGITATVSPSLKPENNEGYFEYVEGPEMGTSSVAINIDNGNNPDQTVWDNDDILMLTTRTTGKPFIGRVPAAINMKGNATPVATGGVLESDVAEVAWFVRGNRLHRRVLIVAPNVNLSGVLPTGYYANCDISAHYNGSSLVANTLADLTRRECRYAHCQSPTDVFPYDVRDWGHQLGLPTLYEGSLSTYNPFNTSFTPLAGKNPVDFWSVTSSASGNYPWPDNVITAGGTRMSDDVILTNVIGFDVKAWDPEQGAYMDLGHTGGTMNGLGHYGQTITGTSATSRVYDTWSTTYYGTLWNDGLDNGGGVAGIVDDDAEKTKPPPYPIPLRGIQVKIRVFEPDSKQVREVTVEQDFLPR